MQERKPIVLSKMAPLDKTSVTSSFCLAPGIIIYTTMVLSSENTSKKESEDTPWSHADLP